MKLFGFCRSTDAIEPASPVIDCGELITSLKKEMGIPWYKPYFPPDALRGQGTEPVQQDGAQQSAAKQKTMQEVETIGQCLVSSGNITQEEANKQVSAIQACMEGKLSYAEMRAIAG